MMAQDKELFSQLYDRNYKRLLYAAIALHTTRLQQRS